MAEIRTMITPFGGTVTFKVEDETYQTPFGGVMNGDITAAAGGTTPKGPLTKIFTGPFEGPLQ